LISPARNIARSSQLSAAGDVETGKGEAAGCGVAATAVAGTAVDATTVAGGVACGAL